MIESLPNTTGLAHILAEYVGRKAYLVPLTDRVGRALGNNGDHLMIEVFHRILEELKIAVVPRPECADVVIVPPNGALLEEYAFPDLLAERLANLGAKDVVIFPSSAYFPSKDPSFIFAGRVAKAIWILRERGSFDHLHETWGAALQARRVTLALDHDVVAAGHQYAVEAVGGPLRQRHILVAARVDREATSLKVQRAKRAPNAVTELAMRVLSLLPSRRLQTLLARFAKRHKLNAAANALLDRARVQGFELPLGLHVTCVDSSSPNFATYDEYKRAIRDASVIVTDRLHVGLPGVLLGKRVVLVEAGYHKIGGVFRRSLSRCTNATLVDR